MSETKTRLQVVIMAAGKGTRMKSDRPKVLHSLAGRPLLQHVLHTVSDLGSERSVVVTGHGADEVETFFADAGCRFVRQMPQLGTGHAVQQAVPELSDEAVVLILNGDVPLIRPSTAARLVQACGGQRLALLSVVLNDPHGYGRIVRSGAMSEGPGEAATGGSVLGVVEEKDASGAQRAIREVYTGMMAVPGALLKTWLGRLGNDNAQKEYYLTDIVAMAVADGVAVVAQPVDDDTEVLGVNSPAQLADLERRLQRRQADELMVAGVRLADPARLDIRGQLICAADVEIDINCIFEGQVRLGAGVKVGAHCVLRDVTVHEGAHIMPFTHAERAEVGPGARVGPYARLRPGARLGAEVHVGNFVEIKNSDLAAGAKANHLAYVGDASIGERANIGAGTITANYDGVNKHRTVVGADVLVGSNCVLVAPVCIGDGATLGAGSTVTRDAPAGTLTVARARQASLPQWQRPRRKA